MSRALWFAAGAATSAYALVKARRAAEAVTTEGIRDRMAGISLGAHLFGDELRQEMTLRETELRERLGLTLDGDAEIGAGPPPALQLTRKGST